MTNELAAAQKRIRELERIIQRQTASVDKGVVLDVTWADSPMVALALALINDRMREWSGQSLVAQTAAMDTLLDLKKLLLTEEVPA